MSNPEVDEAEIGSTGGKTVSVTLSITRPSLQPVFATGGTHATGENTNLVYTQEGLGKKLNSSRRRLIVEMNRLLDELKKCKSNGELQNLEPHLQTWVKDYQLFRGGLRDITDVSLLQELSHNLSEQFDQFENVWESTKSLFTATVGEGTLDGNSCESEVQAEDSVSQLSTSRSSSTSRKSLNKIELDQKKALLIAKREWKMKQVQWEEEKYEKKMQFEQKRLQLEHESAVEVANLIAEEKKLAISQVGSSCSSRKSKSIANSKGVAALGLSKMSLKESFSKLNPSREECPTSYIHPAFPTRSSHSFRPNLFGGLEERMFKHETEKANQNPFTPLRSFPQKQQVLEACHKPLLNEANRKVTEPKRHSAIPSIPPGFNVPILAPHSNAQIDSSLSRPRESLWPQCGVLHETSTGRPLNYEHYEEPVCNYPNFSRNLETAPYVNHPQCRQPEEVEGNESPLFAYIRRQDRRDYLQVAAELKWNGENLPFIFFESQLRELLRNSPLRNHMEVLRAACQGIPREIVNQLNYRMVGISQDEQLEMAISRLRQRYGATNGFLSEKRIAEIRKGKKMQSWTVPALKEFNEELDVCDVYARAHKQVNKLDGKLVFELAGKLPVHAKRKYIEFVHDHGLQADEPTFQSLRTFIFREQRKLSSELALHMFGPNEGSISSRDECKERRHIVRIRQAKVESENMAQSVQIANKVAPNKISSPNKAQPTPANKKYSTPQREPPLCFVCDAKHWLMQCDNFLALTPQKRRDVIIKAGRCLNCLKQSHFARQCPSQSKCKECGPHAKFKHTFGIHDLYDRKWSQSPSREKIVVTNSISGGAGTQKGDTREDTVRNLKTFDKRIVLLRISAVRLINPKNGKEMLVYAQHDIGSQTTLLSETVKKQLDLETSTDSVVTLSTLSGKITPRLGQVDVQLQSLHSGELFNVKGANVVSNWTDDRRVLPHRHDISSLDHFRGSKIHLIPGREKVDLLIGQDNAWLMTVLEEREGSSPDQPNCVLTRLGYTASGGKLAVTSTTKQVRRVHETVVCESAEVVALKMENHQLKEQLRELSLDGEKAEESANDKLARKLVEPYLTLSDDRYEIPVPFLPGSKLVEDNYDVAVQRVLSLRQMALKKPTLMQTLVDTMTELLDNEYISPVDGVELENSKRKWYLPYFVTNQSKPRVVYDASATYGGLSLNSSILSGPDLLNPLTHVLARFRMGRYAVMGDLAKCFFQIRVPPCQQNMFQILWFDKNDVKSGQIKVFKFTRHPWGLNSSPFIACLAIKHIVKENPTGAGNLTLRAIHEDMYMDDLLTSTDSLTEAKAIVTEAIELFKSRGFKMTKWSTNSEAKSLLSNFPPNELAPNVRELDLNKDAMPTSKALGCVWDSEQDTLSVKCSLVFTEAKTRREMCSQLCQQYDPLGIAAAHLLKGRLILHDIAIDGLSWDATVPEDISKKWKNWLKSLSSVEELSVPRNYFPDGEIPGLNDTVTYQLHGFTDASDVAYGAVIYLRRLINDRPQVAFLYGKSRLVLRAQSSWAIAKKELHAATICAELMSTAIEALSKWKCSIHFWSDSTVLLKWLTNPSLRLSRFIKRRVDKVLNVAPPESWMHVPSKENPADVATRENAIRKPEAVSLWLNGPTILRKQQIQVTSQEAIVNTLTAEETGHLDEYEKSPLDCLIEAARDLYTLKKRVAYIMAFKEFVIAKAKHKTFYPPQFNATYLDSALFQIIKYTQRRYFGPAIKLLEKGSPDEFDQIIKRLGVEASPEQTRKLKDLRSLRNLRPCVTSDSALRIDGRLYHAPLSNNAKHPLILPSRSSITRLIVLNEHNSAAHGGPQHTLMLTRQNYWIIHGIASVKHYLKDCSFCAIQKAKPVRQLMADLPACRVSAPQKPFQETGCDYLGPLYYREGRSDKKAWGLLFTCMATRAIHVEIVNSLDLTSFILAFSRFTDYRGPVTTMWSDNGSTFKAAAKNLPTLLQSVEFKNSLRKRGIDWKFIPPYAPAQGGAWESMVKLFKEALVKVSNEARRTPSLIELQTFTSNATRICNDRPLTAVSDHPNDLETISPSSLLGCRLAPYLSFGVAHDKGDLRRDCDYNCTLAERFWDCWVRSYLPTLQGRKKWQTLKDNLYPGQLVLVASAEDITKKGVYKIGRVHALHPERKDGREIVRRATVAVMGKNANTGLSEVTFILRDLSKLAPI